MDGQCGESKDKSCGKDTKSNAWYSCALLSSTAPPEHTGLRTSQHQGDYP